MRTAALAIPPITPAVEARLFARIDKRPDGIWAWLGPRRRLNLAQFRIGKGVYLVARVVWTWHQRKTDPTYQIPEGMCVCHVRDITPELYDCCPGFLWLGTDLDNNRDREAKGRGKQPSGDRNGRRTKPDNWPTGDQHHTRLHPECVARGEDHGSAKLNWGKVHEIRALYAAGGISAQKLANRFGVHKFTIYMILWRKRWINQPAPAPV